MDMLTERLLLREPKNADADTFVRWLNNPEVVKFSEQRHKTHTIESQQDYWKSSATVEPNFVKIICLRHEAGGELAAIEIPIGSISATIDRHNNLAEVGILIGAIPQWGRGYGFEAWQCVCNYLFATQNVRKIEAGCMAKNHGMIHIFKKYAMECEGEKIDHFQFEGKRCGLLMYGKYL